MTRATMNRTEPYVFSHHKAPPDKLARYDAVHLGAHAFSDVLLANVPRGPIRTRALSLLREAAAMACAAVAIEG